MIKTHSLPHIALAVRDVERSLRFYSQVFGAVEVYREGGFLQAQTPGSRDVLVFEESDGKVGESGGIAHFGFRLVDPA
jgi:catechol 2,3-dioxygenase-like lactoylglutathione lyase family enzyme